MEKQQGDPVSLSRNGPLFACEELINFLEVDFNATSNISLATRGPRSLPTGEVISTRVESLIDLNFVPSESVPPLAEASEVRAIEKAVADIINDMSSSHPSASHVMNASSAAGSDDEQPLVVD